MTGFVTRVTRRILLGEQELLILQIHMSSALVFSGISVAQSCYTCSVLPEKGYHIYGGAIHETDYQ